MPKLIVALGNPGKKYQNTRHNIGQKVLEYLGFISSLSWKSKFKGAYASYESNGEKFIFLVPETFMNLSGESIILAAKFFKISPQEVLVLHDELEMPFGTISFKDGGGLGGHNGLRSTAKHLGTNSFLRFRLGIGRPKHHDVSSWVLAEYCGDEKMLLDEYLSDAAKAIEYYMENDFSLAVKEFGKKKLI